MLGTRTFQRPDGPGASTSMTPRTAFERWAMSGAWRRQKSLMARLRSAARSARSWRMSSSRAAACLSSSSCSCPCVVGQNPGDAPPAPPRAGAPPQTGCHAVPRLPGTPLARTLPGCHSGGPPPGAAFRSPGGFPSAGSVPAEDGCRHPTTRARASCAAWRCSNTLPTAAAGMDP